MPGHVTDLKLGIQVTRDMSKYDRLGMSAEWSLTFVVPIIKKKAIA